MSWLNINQSLSSLKGQITNFASEVLSDGPVEETTEIAENPPSIVKELEVKCNNQELEIAALKKQNGELLASLQSERLTKQNGAQEDESSWYWDPPPQNPKHAETKPGNEYQVQIQSLQNEVSTLKQKILNDHGAVKYDDELRKLREENQKLTENLEDLDNQHQLAMERLLLLKKELQKNFEILKQDHEDLKNSNDDYSAENKKLLLKLGERDKEVEHLNTVKTDYETLQHKYQNLERVHSLLRENAEKFQEENQDLHEEVFKLQEQVTKVEHDLELSTKHSAKSDLVPREKYEELIKELKDMNERRDTNHDHLTNIDDNAKGLIENFRREINDLKHQLAQKDSTQDINQKVVIKPDKVMQLYNKYVNFELPVDYVGEIPAPGEDVVLYKLESVFKTVHSFKKDIDSLEHQLSEKNLNVNHLQTQIEDLTTENDYLSTDVQHYERELSEMKKNNDFLISEIAALKNTSKLEPIIETHEDNIVKLESELADCNQINKTFESEIKKIETELSAVKTEKVLLQESLHDLKNKYTTILSELELFKSQAKEIEELENANNNEKTKAIKLQITEIDDLKKRLHLANAKNEQLAIDIHIIENDKVLCTKELDDLRHALKEKCDQHKNFETCKSQLDSNITNLESKLHEVSKQKNEIEDEKLKLEEKMLLLEKENLSHHTKSHTSENIHKTEVEQLNHVLQENFTLTNIVDDLKSKLSHLQVRLNELAAENKSYKNNNESRDHNNATLLQEALNDLKQKTVQEEILQTEIINIRDENLNILEKKVQLEKELSNTDSKIVHLEEEFEKLISDLNEKDALIDSLNATINNNSQAIVTYTQKITDLEKDVASKCTEIDNLNKSVGDLEQKLRASGDNVSQTSDELHKLHIEKEDVTKQIITLTDELSSKNEEISNITLLLETLKNTCNEQASTIDFKDKEKKELNQTIVELTDKLKASENMTVQNDEYSRLVQERQTIEKEVSDVKKLVVSKDNELLELKGKFEQAEKICIDYKAQIDNATSEKAELINLINLKHNESIQYHNEIQRLNHVILEQTNEFKKVLEEKEKLTQNDIENCTNCEKLRITLKEKDEIIMKLTHNSSDSEKLRAELMSAEESVKTLTDKCNHFEKSLASQLDTVKKLTAENVELSEKEQNSTRELERLRHHLVELEENYTQELMSSEQKLTECQTRLHHVEERAKQTSTVYTSNSIRANQEVETLRNQIRLLEKQREEVQVRLSEAEDARSRSEAAVTNLQVVLEQFQMDKESDIRAATEKIRKKMEDLGRENQGLMDEIAKLNKKLEESLGGLQAASRLGDQVETKTAQINDLKEQVRTLQTSVAAAEERYYSAISNQQDRVDKNLIKNLVINYVLATATNNHNKTQVLRILSQVLDFNQQECSKLGLSRTGGPSLAAEFVKFLQQESRPSNPLPDMMGITNASRSSTPTSRKSSTSGPHPFEVSHRRNPSTGSNNLLFQNLDSVETSSQLSVESEHSRIVTPMDTGVNQTRNTEGAILKHVLKDI